MLPVILGITTLQCPIWEYDINFFIFAKNDILQIKLNYLTDNRYDIASSDNAD